MRNRLPSLRAPLAALRQSKPEQGKAVDLKVLQKADGIGTLYEKIWRSQSGWHQICGSAGAPGRFRLMRKGHSTVSAAGALFFSPPACLRADSVNGWPLLCWTFISPRSLRTVLGTSDRCRALGALRKAQAKNAGAAFAGHLDTNFVLAC